MLLIVRIRVILVLGGGRKFSKLLSIFLPNFIKALGGDFPKGEKMRKSIILIGLVLLISLVACEKEPEHEHTWDAGVVKVEATCETDGKKVYTCTICKETKEEPIAKLVHKENDKTDKCAACVARSEKCMEAMTVSNKFFQLVFGAYNDAAKASGENLKEDEEIDFSTVSKEVWNKTDGTLKKSIKSLVSTDPEKTVQIEIIEVSGLGFAKIATLFDQYASANNLKVKYKIEGNDAEQSIEVSGNYILSKNEEETTEEIIILELKSDGFTYNSSFEKFNKNYEKITMKAEFSISGEQPNEKITEASYGGVPVRTCLIEIPQ